MRLKKNLVILLAFLLVFSNLAYVVPAAPAHNLEDVVSETQSVNQEMEDSVSEITDEAQYSPTDIVRIVVELEKEPAISYATEQGVRYKDLAESVQAQLQEDVLVSQDAVQNTISSLGINMEVEYSFTTAVNGFSTEVTYREYEIIKETPGVSKVHISNVYTLPEEQEPNMTYSLDLVKAVETWSDYGYDGEGMIVGIIDSGVDPWHPDMALDEGVEISLTEEMVNESGLEGIYFTDKVPFGYNYMDKNTQILEQGPSISSHGMHVAGTVAANGEIMGVAPNAQLLALRVFGDDPSYGSTYGDIYVKAIDDAIQLGADVINLSLGSPAGFVRPEDPEKQAITRAIENGLVASISAGNSGHFGNALNRGNPSAANPDIGLTGSPSVTFDSIGVASFENSYVDRTAFALTVNGEGQEPVPYHKPSDSPDPVAALGEESYEVVYVEEGRPEQYEGKDVEGKIVLVVRTGDFFYADIKDAAQEQGVAGVIVRGTTGHGDFVNPALGNVPPTVPYLTLSIADGNALREMLLSGDDVEITFDGSTAVTRSSTAGQMSGFTSWGLAPNLDFKPEISAPGGNILSTLQGGGYGIKSGTSMAAPHVAGGSALVLQRIDEHFELEGRDRAEKAKTILLNTSTIIYDKGTYNTHPGTGLEGETFPYSPRRQGSGLMDLHAAMSTPVVLTEVNSGEAKAALKEVGDTFTFTLQAENFGTEDVTYQVDGNVQTDLALFDADRGIFINQIESQGVFNAGTASPDAPWLGEYPIDFSTNEITVPAGETVEFTVTVDLTEAVDWFYEQPLNVIFPNGTFVEGFVTLTDVTEVNPTLALPYVGFYGDWDEAPIVDGKWYEGGAYHTWTGLWDQVSTDNALRLQPIAELDSHEGVNNIFAFSPGEEFGITPIVSFLRNAKDVQYNILDENGDRLRTIRLERDVRKSHAHPGHNFSSSRYWDGTVNRSMVEDGLYYYEIRARVDFEDARWQTVKFPILVDTIAPELTVNYDFDNAVIEWEATEEASGLQTVQFKVDGEEHSTVDVSEGRFSQSGEFDVTGIEAGKTVEVVAVDRAGNSSVEVIEGINDDSVPFIIIDPTEYPEHTPWTLDAFNTFKVPVKGHIIEASGIREFKVNGHVTEVTYNEEKNWFEFDTTVTFEEDGAPDIFFEATDVAGNHVSIKRQVIIDTTAPELQIDVPVAVDADAEEVTVGVTVSDNFNMLRLYVNGSEEYFNPLRAPYAVSNFSDEFELTLRLVDDENTFTFELEDVAGNVTKETITINRSEVMYQRGDREAGVIALKIALAKVGFPVSSNPTTLFGPITERQVTDFQASVGLPETGVVDTITWMTLMNKAYTLQRGDRKQEVIQLKVDLAEAGYQVSANPTTLYGPLTEGAVSAFQADAGLTVTGVADYKTLVALEDATSMTLQFGDHKQEVIQLKLDLSTAGFHVSDNPTTYYGPLTQNAVKGFQASVGLPETGIANFRTLVRLSEVVSNK